MNESNEQDNALVRLENKTTKPQNTTETAEKPSENSLKRAFDKLRKLTSFPDVRKDSELWSKEVEEWWDNFIEISFKRALPADERERYRNHFDENIRATEGMSVKSYDAFRLAEFSELTEEKEIEESDGFGYISYLHHKSNVEPGYALQFDDWSKMQEKVATQFQDIIHLTPNTNRELFLLSTYVGYLDKMSNSSEVEDVQNFEDWSGSDMLVIQE